MFIDEGERNKEKGTRRKEQNPLQLPTSPTSQIPSFLTDSTDITDIINSPPSQITIKDS